MKESELSTSLKFALFLLAMLSTLPIIIGSVLLFCAMLGLIPYQEKVEASLVAGKVIGISDYLEYFIIVGIGYALYFSGRLMNFIGGVIRDVNLQEPDENNVKEKFLFFGQEVCFIPIFVGATASVMGLIDNIAKHRPFGFYTVIIAWGLIVTICLIGTYFLKKLITSKTEF